MGETQEKWNEEKELDGIHKGEASSEYLPLRNELDIMMMKLRNELDLTIMKPKKKTNFFS